MFRAMILSLFGGTFEVRLINTKSGKDIPGTRLCKGGYWKCRKAFKTKNLKYGSILRLQAVTVLDWVTEDQIGASVDPEEPVAKIPEGMIIIDEAGDVPPEVYVDPYDIIAGDGTKEAPWGPAESNQRQSDHMEKNQDEPNAYRGEDPDDHVCDLNGPQDWDNDRGMYRPTCSICGTFEV